MLDGRGLDAETGVGIVGVGVISAQYLDQIAGLTGVRVVAVADVDAARAAQVAASSGARAESVEALLADPAVDIVLNLTTPPFHAEIDRQAVAAGKHVYSEKPLALSFGDGRAVLADAERQSLRVGCAPDTFLGTGLQTTLAALRSGQIGTPFAASAFWSSPGHEQWHPNPGFYYRAGGGPVMDMGPYYLTALVTHLGPVRRVRSVVLTTGRERVVATGPLAGRRIDVEVPTHATAILEHEAGAVSTLTVSFELWESQRPQLEIYGTAGTLVLPDPNCFDGVGAVYGAGGAGWSQLPVTHGYLGSGRGIGLAEMARAIRDGVPHRASGDLALHVLDVMAAIERPPADGSATTMTTTVDVPALVPLTRASDVMTPQTRSGSLARA